MPYRPLGRTGEKVSLLGLGGYAVGAMRDEQEAIRFVHTAIDNGVNFVESCWDYQWGENEIRLGKALRDGYRKKVFLATKIDAQVRPAADDQLEMSLRRLQVETIDLIQFHEVVRPGDPDRIFGPNGAIQTLIAAKKAGKVRYIGFTGHYDPEVHLKMLNTAASVGFAFDTNMMVLNAFDVHYRSFTKKLLPVAVERGVGVLAYKSLAGGRMMRPENALQKINVTPAECLRYVMSLPISVLISGMDTMETLNENLRIAREFQPMSEAEKVSLLTKTKEPGETGAYEWYKHYPGGGWTAEHPWVLG
jgi:predicted aldo/keto reductase-like oxidoreductase